MLQDRVRENILFSCTGKEKQGFDPFVEDHVVIYVINGVMTINDGLETLEFKGGDVGFITKNQLIKAKKAPYNNQLFLSVSVFLPRETLFEYATEQAIIPKGRYIGKPNFIFKPDIFISSYFGSMRPYFENPEMLTEKLAKVKTTELIELLKRDISLQNVLFNFEENFKIDLEAYMNRNYMHNIPLVQFAKLTGRSLSTFKKDFHHLFLDSPTKWLIKKRLDLAHHLMTTVQKKPSEIYLEVGFANFSHFSKSFKTQFGISPSGL